MVVSVLFPNTRDEDGNPYVYFNDDPQVSIFLEWEADDMSPREVKVKYNHDAERINTTDANLMITLDVVDLNTTAAYFVATEQSIQPVNVKLLPQKEAGDAMSVTDVPPTDGELHDESSRKLFLDWGKFLTFLFHFFSLICIVRSHCIGRGHCLAFIHFS